MGMIVRMYKFSLVSSSVSLIREEKGVDLAKVLVDLVGTIKIKAKVTTQRAWWCLVPGQHGVDYGLHGRLLEEARPAHQGGSGGCVPDQIELRRVMSALTVSMRSTKDK